MEGTRDRRERDRPTGIGCQVVMEWSATRARFRRSILRILDPFLGTPRAISASVHCVRVVLWMPGVFM